MTSPNSGPAASPSSDLSTGGILSNEPVLVSHLVTVLLTALVGYGWVAIPNPTINTIATVAGVIVTTGGAFLARAKVSPAGKITWQGVVDEIRGALYDELDRILAMAPAGSYAAAGAAAGDAVVPTPAPKPSPAPAPTPAVAVTQAMPVVSPAVAPAVSATSPNYSVMPSSIPVGTFTTSTAFGPAAPAAPVDPAQVAAAVVPPETDLEKTTEHPPVTGAAVPADPPAAAPPAAG